MAFGQCCGSIPNKLNLNPDPEFWLNLDPDPGYVINFERKQLKIFERKTFSFENYIFQQLKENNASGLHYKYCLCFQETFHKQQHKHKKHKAKTKQPKQNKAKKQQSQKQQSQKTSFEVFS